MRKIINQIPNFITSLNLLSGCFAAVNMLSGRVTIALYATGLALIFDFLDGFVARLLHAKSEIGKQLDSLADVISFGFVPGTAMYLLISINLNKFIQTNFIQETWIIGSLPYLGMLIPVFSALRLAKFNIDERQTTNFIGLPTPANAIAIVSLPYIFLKAFDYILFVDPFVLIAIVAVSCFLLVSPIPMFSLKFEDFTWSNNKIRLIFLVLSLMFLINLKAVAFPIIIVFYILLSIINNLIQRRKNEIQS